MKRRRAGAVAAALKGAKKKKGSKKSKDGSKHSQKGHQTEVVQVVENDPLQEFLGEDPDANKMFGKRVLMLEKILAHKHATEKTVLNTTERKDVMRQREIDGMSNLVEDRIERNSNYTAAFCLTVFFLVSCMTLVAQRDVEQSFMVEGTLFSALMGDLDWESGELTRSDDFYDWLESALISRVFTDPACGDGVCDSPDEFPGFGRFGCIPDCGRYKKTTMLTVKLEDFFEYSKSQTGDMHPDFALASNWDMSGIIDKAKDIHPDYRWNIWSDTMGDYIFAEAQKPVAAGGKVVVDVPDGRLELRLFQYRKVSEEIDVGTIFEQLYLLPNTLPKRTVPTDYGYGDKFEAISNAAIFMKQINDYCFGGTLDQTPPKCEQIPTVDTMFKSLGSYGLKGTITIPNPESKDKPPTPTTLVTLGFCGLLKNGTQGLKNRYNKLNFQTAGMDCGNRRRSGVSVRKLRPSAQTNTWEEYEEEGDLPARHLVEAVQLDANATDTQGRKLLQAVQSPRYGQCTQHGDCNQNVVDGITGVPGQFCSRLWGCDTCSFCQIDGADAINGLCPKAYCPDSGELPGCLSALRMTNDYKCDDKVEFEIWKYHKKGEDEPQVAPPGTAKVRYMTPFNRLVGPIMVTQVRRKTGNCSKVVNPFIKAWAQQGLDSEDGCLQGEDELDANFYGLDPAFVPTAALYDGNLIAEEHYERNERLNKTIAESTSRGVTAVTYPSVPLGFFPYKYDLYNHTWKDPGTYRENEADTFKVYFDTQITQSQAMNMLDFLKDGGFIDDATSSLETQAISYNAELNRFTLIVYTFEWTAGGSITWSYWLESVTMDIYDQPTGTAQMAAEIIVCIMFGLNVWLELVDFLVSVRANKQLKYILNMGNLFDWLHFAFMGLCISLWLQIKAGTEAFTMETNAYPVLTDPYAGARVFTVDIGKEEAYVRFRDDILSLAEMFRLYNAASGTCIILFVFRVLKALDFQPIMGIVTRTLMACSYDMAHFVVLFSLITFGYAFAAVALFGHQFIDMATPEDAFNLLIDIVLGRE